ncbi:MAG TPA: T9SS type A sorting domain-containing protein [bacterium]|jgi:hypothetical protein
MKRFAWVWALLIVSAAAVYAAGGLTVSPSHTVSREYARQKAARGGHHTLDTDTLCSAHVCVTTDEDGDFTIGTPDGRTLLYGYPDDPWSTDIRVSVDGLQYNLTSENGNDCAGVVTFVSETHDATHITDTYSMSNPSLTIVVTHTPVTFSDSSGAVLTRTVVTNTSGTSHNIGVLYEYDTTVDGDDAAQLFLGPSRIAVETCYTAPFSYPYWDAIPSSGSLVGRGTFTGGEAVTPDALAFGAWPDFYATCWADSCTGDPYGDSAVLYRWNEMPVAAGQTRNVATYYGVGGFQTSAGELRITVSQASLQCVDDRITPNPFQILVSVTDSAAIACRSISVQMSGGSGPGGTATITGANPQTIDSITPGHNAAVSFTAQLTPVAAGGLVNFTVNVTAGNCAQNSLNFSVDVPECELAAGDPPNSGLVTAYSLYQNYPNPFNPTTTIAFDLVRDGPVSLKVFNIVGEEVVTLASGPVQRGHHVVQFDASKLPSGVYLYRLNTGEYTAVRKMLLMK